MIVYIPIRLVSVANAREHWATTHARNKRQKNSVIWALYEKGIPKKLPVCITLTKIGGKKMDDDNLVAAFKHIRDSIADYFIPGKAPGRADDSPKFTWKYGYESIPKEMAITLSFEWPQEAQ